MILVQTLHMAYMQELFIHIEKPSQKGNTLHMLWLNTRKWITVEKCRSLNHTIFQSVPIVLFFLENQEVVCRDTPRLFLDPDQTPHLFLAHGEKKDSQPSLGDFFLRVTHDMRVHIHSEVCAECKCPTPQWPNTRYNVHREENGFLLNDLSNSKCHSLSILARLSVLSISVYRFIISI